MEKSTSAPAQQIRGNAPSVPFAVPFAPHKAQLDGLVGQVESLQPGKNAILIVLCGGTNPALVTRFKEKYGIAGKAVVFGPGMGVVVKGDVGKTSKS